MKKDPNNYPPGLNLKKVKDIINYYENQTDEEAIAEAEASYTSKGTTMVQVPTEFVHDVVDLIENKKAAS